MNKFEQNTWYFWLTNYMSELIRKSEGGFKDKILSLFKLKQKKIKLKIEYLEIFRHFLNIKKKKEKEIREKKL